VLKIRILWKLRAWARVVTGTSTSTLYPSLTPRVSKAPCLSPADQLHQTEEQQQQ